MINKQTVTFSILITTKNRLEELKYTLNTLQYLVARPDVQCMICDDGSTDSTSDFIKEYYPKVTLIQNDKSKGLIYSRNRLLNLTKAKYAITLDDDANILSENPLETIEVFFYNNKKCAVIATRIFWGKELPKEVSHSLANTRVKCFVGCGHIWRMEAWHSIPNYPSWFVFYGEEEFASYELFKKKWEVWFVPNILIHHRVNIKSRKKNKDYTIRLRRSLRSGWYLYFLFCPLKLIPRKFLYTLWRQLKLKVFKGDLRALEAISLALLDVVYNSPKFINKSTRLPLKKYKEYQELTDTKIYWK